MKKKCFFVIIKSLAHSHECTSDIGYYEASII